MLNICRCLYVLMLFIVMLFGVTAGLGGCNNGNEKAGTGTGGDSGSAAAGGAGGGAGKAEGGTGQGAGGSGKPDERTGQGADETGKGAGGTGSQEGAGQGTGNLNFSVIRAWPHDTTSFTEGLLVHEGALYESTGHTEELASSRSLFGIVDPATGRIDVKVELDKQKYFGEGIVFLHGKVYQLTYRTRVGFVYDAKTFRKLGEFRYPGREGWGMTTDGVSLIITDGSPVIYYMDPETFGISRKLTVTDNNVPVERLNELEYINGYLYANVYSRDFILKIDPADGRVRGRLDLSSLVQEARSKYPASLELNGIAFDSVQDKVYVTGKMWPAIYEIRFPH